MKRIRNAQGQVAQERTIELIEPGVVYYSADDLNADKGQMLLIDREAIERLAKSIDRKGIPIFNWDHRDVGQKDFTEGEAQGVLVGPATMNGKGRWEAKAYIWDAETLKNIEQGYRPSCAYEVTALACHAGKHNNVPYDDEVLDGVYTHVAIVDNPRYERLEIHNSKRGGLMKLWSFGRSKEGAGHLDLKNATVDLGKGKTLPLEMLLKWAEKETKQRASNIVEDSRIVMFNGLKATVGELKTSYLASLTNESEEEDEKDEKENSEERENAKEKRVHMEHMKHCSLCQAAEDSEEEAEKETQEEMHKEEEEQESDEREEEEEFHNEKEDEEEDEEDDEKDVHENESKEEEREEKDEEEEKRETRNALKRKKAKDHFDRLDNARREMPAPKFQPYKTMQDREADGRARYGAYAEAGKN
jgi:Uncharacterized protein conserved in bacteria (DUF2213)